MYQTCHRRFQEWRENRVIEHILRALADDLMRRGKLKVDEAFIDTAFVRAKKGGLLLVLPKSEKARNYLRFQTADRYPPRSMLIVPLRTK